MDRSFAAAKEQALRHFEVSGGADKLKALVESCWENPECIEAASAEFVNFTHRNDIFTELGDPIDRTSLETVEEMAASAAGRTDLFPEDGHWMTTSIAAASRVGKLIQELAPEILEDWHRVFSEDLVRAACDHEERQAVEEVLRERRIRFRSSREPGGLARVLRAISDAGGVFYLMPLLRMALRDGHAVAFRRGRIGFEIAVATDWLDMQMPHHRDEGWRFFLVRDLPTICRGHVGKAKATRRGRRARSDVEVKVGEWFEREVGDGRNWDTKGEALAEIKEELRRRSGRPYGWGRASLRIWESYAPEKWREPGRKPRPRHG